MNNPKAPNRNDPVPTTTAPLKAAVRIRLNENIRYTLQAEAAVEDFDDGSLVFLCRKRQLIHINTTARNILGLLDGKKPLKEIIELISRDYSITPDAARTDVLELVDDLGTAGVLKAVVKLGFQESHTMNATSHYLVNPDVSLREEDGDGAILYYADADALLIINPIGLMIWKHIQTHPRTKADIIEHLKHSCEGVPVDQVETDVTEFLKDLLAKGFVGEVAND